MGIVVATILFLIYLPLLGALLIWCGATIISAINLWMLGTGSIVTVASNLKIFVILFLIWIPLSAVVKACSKSSDE